MDSSEAYSPHVYSDEVLATLLANAKEPSGVELSPEHHRLALGDSALICPSPLVGGEAKESGNGEVDEGFEDDFCEEEFSEESALQRDSDPSLNEVTLLKALSLDPLEEVLMPSLAEFPGSQLDELIDTDQGVALDSADIHPVESYSDTSSAFDLPFSSPMMTTPSVVSEPLCSPYQLTSPGYVSTQTFSYPHDLSLPAVPHTMPEHFVSGLETTQVNAVFPCTTGLSAGRQNSELDLICSVIEDVGHSVNTATHPHGGSLSVGNTKLLNQLVNGDMDNLWLPIESYPLPSPTSGLSCLTNTHKTVPTSSSLTDRLDCCEHAQLIPIGALHANESRGSQTESKSGKQSSSLPRSNCSPATNASGSNEHDSFGSLPASPASSTGNDSCNLVEMPFYQFKKLIDSPQFSERDKEQVKVIRKRGKNKMAAKSCRQRKIELILSLQQEVDQLKGLKARLALRALTLQREIEQYKSQCSQPIHTLAAPLHS